jgi:hypothetical protein
MGARNRVGIGLSYRVGNLSPAMGARNQVGIGLSYRPSSLSSWATQFQTRFLESIPRPIAGLKFLAPARNGVGIGLSHRLARQYSLAESVPWNRFSGSLRILKIRAQDYVTFLPGSMGECWNLK